MSPHILTSWQRSHRNRGIRSNSCLRLAAAGLPAGRSRAAAVAGGFLLPAGGVPAGMTEGAAGVPFPELAGGSWGMWVLRSWRQAGSGNVCSHSVVVLVAHGDVCDEEEINLHGLAVRIGPNKSNEEQVWPWPRLTKVSFAFLAHAVKESHGLERRLALESVAGAGFAASRLTSAVAFFRPETRKRDPLNQTALCQPLVPRNASTASPDVAAAAMQVESGQ